MKPTILAAFLVLLSPLFASEVLIVRQVHEKPTRWVTQSLIDGFVGKVEKRLHAIGVDAERSNDTQLQAEKLKDCRLLILPYNPNPSPELLSTIETFVANGGKLVACYNSQPRLLKLLGISGIKHRTGKAFPKTKGIDFDKTLFPGAPEQMLQNSWNINDPIPATKNGAKVVAHWLDDKGGKTEFGALTLNPNGAALSHVYLDEDPRNGERFWLALTGHFISTVWSNAVEARLKTAGVYYRCQGPDELAGQIAALDHSPAKRDAEIALGTARRELDTAHREQRDKNWHAAFDAAGNAINAFDEAFLLSRRPRRGELRGAWIHSAYGIRGWNWDQTIKVLADNGFNAIFANMCWGAVADYDSDVLPVHPDVTSKGDQIQACLQACRKYGLELHVWRVNWNMGHRTPKEIRDKMIADGKTQVGLDGRPSNFLAPHLEENFCRERDAMLEIVRKYPVDGIHFDYIRYPNGQCDFSDSAREAFEKWANMHVEQWPQDCANGGEHRKRYNEWRRENITRLVKTVYKEAHAIRKDIQVSAAVFGSWDHSPNSIAQATEEWLENGWLDFVCPMDYTSSNQTLKRWMSRQEPAVPSTIPYYVGLGTWRHDGPVRSAEQVELAREYGADGFICFCHRELFANSKLPGLALGTTAEKAGFLPHHSIRVDFKIDDPPEEFPGFLLGGEIAIQAKFPEALPDLQANVTLLRNGFPIASGNQLEVKKARKGIKVTFTPREPGYYRLELRSPEEKMKDVPLLARSRNFKVCSQEEMQEAILRASPPQFTSGGNRITVAVWEDNAYGGTPILEALKKDEGLDVAPLWNMKPESLAACNVIILPQPRRQVGLFRDKKRMARFKDYVRKGGGVLTTHALVGIRDYVPIVPEIATGDKTVGGTNWKAAAYHPINRNVRRGTFQSSFGDRVSVVPGKKGRIIATTADRKKLPVVVAGQYKKGRYVACGLGLGIGDKDQDTDLKEDEIKLLLDAIRWLANRR